MTEKFIFKNHQLIKEKQAQISIHERGFLFGDGIFETCKIFNGKIYDYKSHENRIKSGLKSLKFSAEIFDLEKKSYQLIKKNKIKNGILRISISRGIGSAGYLPTYESKALIIIETLPERTLPKTISLGISSYKTPKNSLGKTSNALPYILTKIEAQGKKLFDCIMLSQENFIAETSSANIFWVKNGKIFTPKKSCGILLGTVRDKILKKSFVKIKEVEAKISALKNADEIFLTNSSFLITPVDNLDFSKRKLQKVVGEALRKKLLEEFTKTNLQN
jgi:branched-chain amino acid aminotransferase